MATRVTMHDVAKLAGVSQRTVSNVVNDFRHVAPATRDRVQRAITALDYRPHVTAQRLRGGRTGIVALALPEITVPYFAEIADLIQREAHAQGITLLIDRTEGTRRSELLVLDGYRSNLIDGLILNPLALSAGDILERELDVPIVLLGEQIESGPLLHVSIDNVAAAREATEHLLLAGRRDIAVVGAPRPDQRTGPAVRRLQGHLDALRHAGLPVRPDRILEAPVWNRLTGYELAARLLRSTSPPDAVFCFNDLLALGALKATADLAVRVPQDIAVLGWDDSEEAIYSVPSLTSVSPDKQAIATAAVARGRQPHPADGDAPRPGCALIARGSPDATASVRLQPVESESAAPTG